MQSQSASCQYGGGLQSVRVLSVLSVWRRARLVAEGWTLGERQGAVIATRYWFSLDNRCHLT